MSVRTTIAGAGLSAMLTVTGCGTMAILASATISACSSGTSTPSAGATSPGAPSPTPAITGNTTPASPTTSPTTSPPASPTVTPTHHTQTPSVASVPPSAAPATGGGGTAGVQDTLLFALGGVAVVAGAGSIAYRRKIIRNR
jgi:hypothetical protein